MRKHLMIILLPAITAGCKQQRFDVAEETLKITEAWTDWSKKALTGKPDSIAYYFADDALIVDQSPEPIRGKAEMIKIYANAPTNPELDIIWEDEAKPHLIKFSGDGDMAYSLDYMRSPAPDSAGTRKMTRNKVLHIWKKDDDGNWKVSLLMVCPEVANP